MNRVGDWIQTYTGKAFWPLDPHEDDIDIHDIAHALSLQCRFGGHGKNFYSVAEHSVRVSHILSYNGFSKYSFHGLIHDAAEAYIGDLTRPLKRNLPDFSIIEDKIMKVILSKYDITDFYEEEVHSIVKKADDTLLKIEAKQLMSKPPYPWREYLILHIPENYIIDPLAPEKAEILFMKEFLALRN